MIHFVSFFEPVAIASTQVSSVGITIHYRTLVAASASNCIHALPKKKNIVTMPTHDVLLRHFWKMSLTVNLCGCTLLSLMYCWFLDCLALKTGPQVWTEWKTLPLLFGYPKTGNIYRRLLRLGWILKFGFEQICYEYLNIWYWTTSSIGLPYINIAYNKSKINT